MGHFWVQIQGPTKTSEMDPLPILVPVPDFHPGSHPVSGFFFLQKLEIWKRAGQMWKTGQDISCQFLTLHGIIYGHWTLCLAIQLGHGNIDLWMPFCRWPDRTLHLKTGFFWHRLESELQKLNSIWKLNSNCRSKVTASEVCCYVGPCLNLSYILHVISFSL